MRESTSLCSVPAWDLAHHCPMGEIRMLGTMPESYDEVYMRNVLL